MHSPTKITKSLSILEENSLTPKTITITPGGTAGTTTTITSTQTSNISVDLKHLAGLTEDVTATYVRLDSRGVANGVATLDVTGKLPNSQLTVSAQEYLGNWDVVTNTPALADGVGNTGDVYRVNVAGTRDLGSGSIVWNISDWAIYNGTIWEQAPSPGAVSSVFSRTGAITAQSGDYTKAQVGLGNVDNTSDATKFTNTPLTGIPTAPTASNGTNTTQIATTAFANAITITDSNITNNTISAAKLTNNSVSNTQLAVSARQINKQVFTGSGTFTTPASSSTSTVYKVTCIGGGGGGGRWGGGNGSGGGGGAATSIGYFSGFTPSQNISVTVGAGGAGATANATNGSNGAYSVFSTMNAEGGYGGIANGDIAIGGFGGQSTNSVGGDIRCSGSNGTFGDAARGGIGGSSSLGGGGSGSVSSGSVVRGAASGGAFGGGGGGGIASDNGGTGSSGIVIIEWVL